MKINYYINIMLTLFVACITSCSLQNKYKYIEYWDSAYFGIMLKLQKNERDSGFANPYVKEYFIKYTDAVVYNDNNKYFGEIICITNNDSDGIIKEFGIYSINIKRIKDSSIVFRFNNSVIFENELFFDKKKIKRINKKIFKIITENNKTNSKDIRKDSSDIYHFVNLIG